jgi:Mlc titration factor MtfA (ptsG expression regulator)
MIFSWLKNRRRNKRMAAPFPQAWLRIIERNVKQFAILTPEQQTRVCRYVAAFVPEKYWEGCGGQEMNDEVQVTIAALVGVMMLGFEPPYFFDRVKSILVYPAGYQHHEHTVGAVGNVALIEEDVSIAGEAWSNGPVILSWDAVERESRRRYGENVVFHEFAHCLDRLDGVTDGVPPLSREDAQTWKEVTDAEYRRLRMDYQRGRPTLINPYGATNKVEFFAVATECFFELPRAMQREHPQLFDIFRRFYRQDPARWGEDSVASTHEDGSISGPLLA